MSLNQFPFVEASGYDPVSAGTRLNNYCYINICMFGFLVSWSFLKLLYASWILSQIPRRHAKEAPGGFTKIGNTTWIKKKTKASNVTQVVCTSVSVGVAVAMFSQMTWELCVVICVYIYIYIYLFSNHHKSLLLKFYVYDVLLSSMDSCIDSIRRLKF